MSRNQISRIRSTTSGPKGSVASEPFTVGDRIYLKLGRFGTRMIHRAATVALLALVILADYLLVLFTAVNVLPNIAALVQQGTGVTMDMRIDAAIAGWLLPVLFIAAAVLVGEVFLMRRLWRAARSLLSRMSRSLFRLHDEQTKTPATAQGSPKPRATKIAAAS
ncbi:hypothetical protein [Arthrobacter koreensis]|uniref:hypothetical protein n=1 Tax=Arthrobacter koreensis TaxID=199136 RepID=UPI0038260647